MRLKNSAGFEIKSVRLNQKGFTYETFSLTGWLNGRRIRKQFKSRDEAHGEKLRLEVEAANTSGQIRTVVTRLTDEQARESEAVYRQLAGRSLTDAVQWYLTNYRPPVAEIALTSAVTSFLAEKERHVRPLALRDYRRTLARFCATLPDRCAHTVTTAEVEKFLLSLGVGKKRWNNLRGDLHAFFNYCVKSPREWVRSNPASPISPFKISRSVPEILTLSTCRDLMRYVETYAGGPQSGLPSGVLAPYFALTLFAGLRPSVPDGEVCKLGRHPHVSALVDLALNAIRITPDIAKTNDVRRVTIRPNLSKWLVRFPLERFPVVPKNARRMIQQVREKFRLTDDVLRHTFISMHVAKFKSLGEAALEAGNSEAMIRKHYLNLVSEQDAGMFWDISPNA